MLRNIDFPQPNVKQPEIAEQLAREPSLVPATTRYPSNAAINNYPAIEPKQPKIFDDEWLYNEYSKFPPSYIAKISIPTSNNVTIFAKLWETNHKYDNKSYTILHIDLIRFFSYFQ